MTQSTVVYTDAPGSAAAGAALGGDVATAFGGASPDAVVVFASPRYAHVNLLAALQSACHPSVLVGCSSAGEFTHAAQGQDGASAVAFSSPEMRFSAALGTGVRADPARAAAEITEAFPGMRTHDYRYRSALILADALAGHTDELVERLTVLTAGTYQFFGGGAGDNAQFQHTPVFFAGHVVTDAVVALEILSRKPIGVGVRHGWTPATPGMRVTQAEGMRLVSLNAMPAVEAFEEHARATGQRFDPADPIPFFLHNVLGIAIGMDDNTDYKLRVPLGVNADGSVDCAAEIPAGAIVHIMRASATSAAEAAAEATRAALAQLGGSRPQVALFFDCVATRLRLGSDFGLELRALRETLGAAQVVGCNTHGQVARAEGQFSGFHNCTAVVGVFPT